MTVIVKGMEMPDSCGNCPLRRSNENRVWCYKLGEYIDFDKEYDGRRSDCPLIELPPHGDLVDLSNMIHPNDSMRLMTIDEQLRRTCEGWGADRKQYVVIEAEE